MRIVSPVLCLALAGCSSAHRFEVDLGDIQAERAELTLYGETTAMERSGHIFSGRRPGRGDGSGRIEIFVSNQPPVTCPIGYVTSNDPEPHRFSIRAGRCEPS